MESCSSLPHAPVRYLYRLRILCSHVRTLREQGGLPIFHISGHPIAVVSAVPMAFIDAKSYLTVYIIPNSLHIQPTRCKFVLPRNPWPSFLLTLENCTPDVCFEVISCHRLVSLLQHPLLELRSIVNCKVRVILELRCSCHDTPPKLCRPCLSRIL